MMLRDKLSSALKEQQFKDYLLHLEEEERNRIIVAYYRKIRDGCRQDIKKINMSEALQEALKESNLSKEASYIIKHFDEFVTLPEIKRIINQASLHIPEAMDLAEEALKIVAAKMNKGADK